MNALSRLPLNRLAREHLERMGAPAEDSSQVPALNLVEWLLDSHPEEVPLPMSERLDHLRTIVQQIREYKPQTVMRLLLRPDGETIPDAANRELREQHRLYGEIPTPQQMAASLLENLDDNLQQLTLPPDLERDEGD